MSKYAARCLTHRKLPIPAEATCCLCGCSQSDRQLHRHHRDILGEPLSVEIVCIVCHPQLDRRDGTRRTVKPANCKCCGSQFQPKRSCRAVLCGAAQCAKKYGLLAAAKRWAS